MAHLATIFFRVLELLIVIRILFSWLPGLRNNDFYKFVFGLTEPLLKPFRKALMFGSMGIDLSPIIVFFILQFLEKVITGLLLGR